MFTFKTNKSTGRYASFFPETIDIKIKKLQVGTISSENKISFAVKKEATKEDPANFKWVTLAKQFETPDAAKTFLNERFENVTKQFDLYSFPKD